MSKYVRLAKARTYQPVAKDDRLLVKVDEYTWISNSLIEQGEDDMEIEAYLKGQKKTGNIVFIEYEDITENPHTIDNHS